MKRRDFIWLAALAAVPAAGGLSALTAQPPGRVRLVAMLSPLPLNDPEALTRLAAIKRRLNDLGWIEGDNIVFDVRSTNGDPTARTALAKELVGLNPDVITAGSSPDTAALLQETRSIPIVFSTAADPVGSGFVRSLARPGGNVTGFTNNHPAIAGKWLEFLKEIAPRTDRVAVLFNPKTTANGGEFFLEQLRASGPSLAVKVAAAPVSEPAEFEDVVAALQSRLPDSGSLVGAVESALAAVGAGPTGGLLVLPDSFTFLHRASIVALAARHRIPAIYPFQTFVNFGGLISYGVDLEEPARQAAAYIDLILRGADPAELPVQTPRKFELIINLKVAEKLGLAVPPSLLVRADKVI
jgi:putative tryptophan/tyrosine transport system substrate-binding protein